MERPEEQAARIGTPSATPASLPPEPAPRMRPDGALGTTAGATPAASAPRRDWRLAMVVAALAAAVVGGAFVLRAVRQSGTSSAQSGRSGAQLAAPARAGANRQPAAPSPGPTIPPKELSAPRPPGPTPPAAAAPAGDETEKPSRPAVEPPPAGPARPEVGALAPDIAIARWWVGRGRDTLEAYRDTYLVIHFLAPTCNACARTIMALNDVQDKFRGRNVHFIGIARVVEQEPTWSPPSNTGGGRSAPTGDTGAAMGPFIQATRPRYPIAVDLDGASLRNYHVRTRLTDWHLTSTGAVDWREHTLRGDKGETSFLIGRNGAILWAGEGGDEALVGLLSRLLSDDEEKQKKYEESLQRRVDAKAKPPAR